MSSIKFPTCLLGSGARWGSRAVDKPNDSSYQRVISEVERHKKLRRVVFIAAQKTRIKTTSHHELASALHEYEQIPHTKPRARALYQKSRVDERPIGEIRPPEIAAKEAEDLVDGVSTHHARGRVIEPEIEHGECEGVMEPQIPLDAIEVHPRVRVGARTRIAVKPVGRQNVISGAPRDVWRRRLDERTEKTLRVVSWTKSERRTTKETRKRTRK